MLLAQRPQTMGPTQPPGGLPFGYDINNPNGDPTADHLDLFANPGDLELQGQSLLGPHDTDYLQSFFGGFQNDNLGTSWGEGLGQHSAQWSDELLVGHELNFGVNPNNMLYQEPMQQYNSALPMRPHYGSHGNNNTFPSTPIGQPSADVLSAATALLPAAEQQSSHNNLQFMHQGMAMPLHQDANNFNLFAPDPGPSHSQPSRPPRGVEVQFGSDPSFSNAQHFVPKHERESTEHIAAKQLATLSCLQRNHSNAPTRAPSPEPWAASHPTTSTTNGVISPLELKTSDLLPNPPQNDGSSSALKKRRRSDKSTDSDDEDEDQERSVTQATPISVPSPLRTALSPPIAKRRKPSIAASAVEEGATPPGHGKRKKSTAAKPPRENLTEDQKRQNHIRSEQKRRNIIKLGFEKLNEIVPTVINQNLSKAGVLIATHEWIAQLVKENEELERLLASAGNKA
ncbi:hypothetical protein QBC40DRAFT_107205 [Triangularia verruculosa]|uniref:BHLH domain-containing protein n=1 Tax=Triangularia verruculosa TaxID=2587418 RepID=A0AAN6XAU2_9PEZI|nr:hypothetical protein QBC40DRAFT_107205 [Triangularia verruculosa]